MVGAPGLPGRSCFWAVFSAFPLFLFDAWFGEVLIEFLRLRLRLSSLLIYVSKFSFWENSDACLQQCGAAFGAFSRRRGV